MIKVLGLALFVAGILLAALHAKVREHHGDRLFPGDLARGLLVLRQRDVQEGLVEAAEVVATAAAPDSNIIFGAVIDDSMMDQIRVTVIATGFDGRRKQETMSFAAGEEEGTPFMPSFEPIAEEDLDIPAFLKKRTF